MLFELIIVNEIQTSKEIFQVPKQMKVPWGKVRSFWRMVKPKLSKICCVLFIVKGQVLSKTNYSSNPTSSRIFIKFAIFNQHYKRKHQTGTSSWCHCLLLALGSGRCHCKKCKQNFLSKCGHIFCRNIFMYLFS